MLHMVELAMNKHNWHIVIQETGIIKDNTNIQALAAHYNTKLSSTHPMTNVL